MFGRFLEISLYTPAIRESLAFYESLGFTVTASLDLPQGGPTVWAMQRSARHASPPN